MLKSLQDKFANFAGSFYDYGSGFFKLDPLSSWLRRHLAKPPGLLSIELFVAISLAVYYFFLMFPQTEAPRQVDGSEMNAYLFTYLSDHPYSQKDIASEMPNWKTRLAGPMISGWAYDQTLKNFAYSVDTKTPDSGNFVFAGYRFNINNIIFGSYHATWLFLLFVILILHRKDALLIMLGVFSGLMYNLIIPAGQWFYPWDIPTMLFFTWACLLYDKRQLFPLILVVWMGSLFKETTLCCTLLILLGEHWTLKKRIAGFAITVIACLLTRKLLMAVYGVKTTALALNDAANIHGFLFNTWSLLVNNIDDLFSMNLNHVLFANAGALFLMLLIPWRNRRDVVFKILAVAFIIGQFLCGIIHEFRIWYEILPLGWMVISEAISNLYKSDSHADVRVCRVMKGSYWLLMVFMLVVAAGVWILGNLITPESEIENLAASGLGVGNKSNEPALQVDRAYEEAADSPAALNNRAWELATSPDVNIRNGTLAVKLAERACELTHYQQTIMVGTLAAAYAEAGRFDEAIATGQKACALASESGQTNLLKRNQELVILYQAHRAYHESSSSSDVSPPH